MEADVKQLRNEWYGVELIRGIPLQYKGKKLLFNKVYLRDTNMGDFDKVSSGVTQDQSNESAMQVLKLVSRGIVSEAYNFEDCEYVEANAKIKKKIHQVERKLAGADELASEGLRKRLEELKGQLTKPDRPYAGVDEVITFPLEAFKSEDMRTADFVRLSKAFKEINMLEEEEIEDFLVLPEN
jgi:hypothetical protein